MLKRTVAVGSVSVTALLVGIAMMGVAAMFLRRLDDRAFGDPAVFYASTRHYGLLGWRGALVSLAGSIGLALLLDWKIAYRAAALCGVLFFFSASFGLYVFPIHFPSGAIYFSLLVFTSGACVAFAVSATTRCLWFRAHQSPQRAERP
jgi:hypothetical protein